jgi:hypothetical protein
LGGAPITYSVVTPALLRAALTNNPFLRQMPAVSLSADTQPAERIGDAPDSRPVMPDLLKTLAKLHGLPEDADEAKVLEAATNAKTAADAKPPESTDTPKTLDALAKAEGKMVLDAAQVATLTENAAKGLDAAKRLDAMTFEAAWDKAFQRGALDAKPETKELHAGIYEADPERSLKLLEGLPGGVVNLTAKGEGGDHSEVATTLDGHAVDPESAKLDQQVKARMKDKGEGYMVALAAIQDAEAMVL